MTDSQLQGLLRPLELSLSESMEDVSSLISGDFGKEDKPTITTSKAWAFLFLAILLEVFGTVAMKLSAGFTKPIPSVLVYVFYVASLALFPFALQAIELSTAYALWSGLGTCLTVLVGFVWFNDTINMVKLLALVAIMMGCVAVKYADGMETASNHHSD